jgi:hypothetical protein
MTLPRFVLQLLASERRLTCPQAGILAPKKFNFNAVKAIKRVSVKKASLPIKNALYMYEISLEKSGSMYNIVEKKRL